MKSIEELVKSFKAALLSRADPFGAWGPAEWEQYGHLRLIGQLRKENLDLLFYCLLRQHGWLHRLPPASHQVLKQAYQVEKGAQLMAVAEMQKLTRAAGDVPMLFLKGPVLASWLQLDLYKRSGDLDMLVKKEDVPRVVPLLRQMGYLHLSTDANGEFAMRNERGLVVDVHYDLSASSSFIYISRFKVAALLRRRQWLNVQGFSLPVPDQDLGFVHLCVHFAINHQFHGCMLLFELITYLRLYQQVLNWQWIIKYSKEHNLYLLLYITLRMVQYFDQSCVQEQWLTDLVPNGHARQRADGFMQTNGLIGQVIQSPVSMLHMNQVPSLCADTVGKQLLYYAGVQLWWWKLYKLPLGAHLRN